MAIAPAAIERFAEELEFRNVFVSERPMNVAQLHAPENQSIVLSDAIKQDVYRETFEALAGPVVDPEVEGLGPENVARLELQSTQATLANNPVTIAQRNAWGDADDIERAAMREPMKLENLGAFNAIAARAAGVATMHPDIGPPLATAIRASLQAVQLAAPDATIQTEGLGTALTWFQSRTFFNRVAGEERSYPPSSAASIVAVLESLNESLPLLPVDGVARHRAIVSSILAGQFLISQTLKQRIDQFLNSLLQRRPNWKIGIQCRFNVIHTTHADVLEKTIVTNNVGVLNRGVNIHDFVEQMILEIWTMMAERDFGKSGFQLLSVYSVRVDAARYEPGVVGTWISTPPCIANKKCTLNIRNFDERCAQYAVCLAAMIQRHPEKKYPSHYEDPTIYGEEMQRFNWSGIDCPMPPTQWDTFEKHNSDFAVFVYEPVVNDDGSLKEINICRLPKNRQQGVKMLFLLLLEKVQRSEATGEEIYQQHYCVITNMQRLFNKSGVRKLCCPFCICRLDETDFQSHLRICSELCNSSCTMPPPGSVKEFVNLQNTIPAPIRIIADFECRMEDAEITTIDNATGQQIVEKVRHHIPVSVGIFVDNIYEGKSEENLDCPTVIFKSENPLEVVGKMIKTIFQYSDEIERYLRFSSDNRHSQCDAQSAAHVADILHDSCCFCSELLSDCPPAFVRMASFKKTKRSSKRKRGDKCEDISLDELQQECEDLLESLLNEADDLEGDESLHSETQVLQGRPDFPAITFVNHHTGEFVGFSHIACSQYALKRFKKTRVPCFFHNGTGYDLKLILKYLGDLDLDIDFEKLFCIAQSSERFKRIDITKRISIVDSMSHLNASLDKLVSRVTNNGKDSDKCEVVKRVIEHRYPFLREDEWKLVTRKGVFPYAWFDNFSKFSTTELPPREAFHSDLTNEDVCEADYDYACKVWRVFQCQSFEDYHDLYLLVDICGLADVMRSYVSFAMKNFKLDPTCYASSPAFAQDAMLKITKAKLQLISDIDIYMAFERSVRGGVSAALLPYVEVDNKYLRQSRGDDSMEERSTDKFLTVWDENNMYGGSMCENLPVGEFQWLSHAEVEHFDLQRDLVMGPCEQGQLLEVDLFFPPEVHDHLNSFPPAPERMVVTDDLISQEQREVFESKKRSTRTAKLVPHLGKHSFYMVHGHTLRLYLSLGAKVSKIHRIMTFRQEKVMKPFVDLCTRLRIEADAAGDDFGVDQAKISVNSNYGKTLEDARGHCKFKLVSARDTESPDKQAHYRRLLSKNTLQNMYPMGTMWVLHFAKKTVMLDKCPYLGSAILDLSKRSIYNFWFNVILKNFPGAQLAYTDTDSAVCVIPSGDVFRDCKAIEERDNGGPITQPGQGYFDWSSLDPSSPYFSRVNAKILRKFKFDMGSKIPTSIICLRSKMYSISNIWDPIKKKFVTDKKTAKGIPRQCRNDLNFHECFATGEIKQVEFVKITGRHFNLQTQKQRKEGLAPALLNDKRFITKDASTNQLIVCSLGYQGSTSMQQ